MDRAAIRTLAKHWRWEKDREGLAWLTFDKQGESANTFSRQALEELSAVLHEIRGENPKGLIIRSAKDGFVAGADVNEFVKFKNPAEALAFVRLGWDVFQELRDLPFPTTAMVNGFCVGGGLELALACRYRVALDDPKTRFAFPEVMLGIMPAWHGVQWLPKLVGPAAALDMMLTGRAIDARRAKRMGLVDQAVPLRILENTARVITLEALRRRPPEFTPRRVHVVGAGVMGGDIAAVCAMRGLTVTLQDTAAERIAPAVKRAGELFQRRLRDARRVRDALDRLIPDVSGAGARHADVIIEAIFENLEAKRQLFAKLEALAKPDAVLATNTSSLKLADIATVLKNPSRLVGIHFFNPVPQLQLVEVVAGDATDEAFAKKAVAFVRYIDKLPLPVKDAPGFLVNRVLGPYMQNAFRMLDEGIKPRH